MDDGENKNKDEVVFIQDIGFSVKIVSPGTEPFDIQVSNLISVVVKVYSWISLDRKQMICVIRFAGI